MKVSKSSLKIMNPQGDVLYVGDMAGVLKYITLYYPKSRKGYTLRAYLAKLEDKSLEVVITVSTVSSATTNITNNGQFF